MFQPKSESFFVLKISTNRLAPRHELLTKVFVHRYLRKINQHMRLAVAAPMHITST